MAATPTTGDYLLKLERDMVGGFQHLLILQHLHRSQVLHGYGLIRAMDQATGNRGLWKEGTIYPLLAAMETEGLVRSRWGVGEEGPRRKYYELTGAGRQVLRLAKGQWADLRELLDALLEEPK